MTNEEYRLQLEEFECTLEDEETAHAETLDMLKAAQADRDTGWAVAEKLCESLRHVHAYLARSGNLSDADELGKVIFWFDAAKAKRNPNPEERT